MQTFMAAMPAPSPEELAKLLRADLDEASSKGCTSLHDAGVGALLPEGDLALIDAVMAGNSGVRYAGFLVSTNFARWQEMKLRPGVRSPRFTLNGIEAWGCGSAPAQTAFQRSPAGRGVLAEPAPGQNERPTRGRRRPYCDSLICALVAVR
ncbi:hypothetical protein CLD22_12005 [Rubrivivax gelatinosus]|nr:hypothetical protein [Rubrivivax gelatinosus]